MASVENEALQSAIDNAAVGEVVVLANDITLTNRINVSNIVTIDLNGHIITGNINDNYGAIYVGTKGVLTIIDSSDKQTGGITNTVGNAIGNYGVVEVYGGTFIGKYALYNFYYNNSVYGTSTIHSGVFQSIDGNSPSIANCGNLTINGGSIEIIDTTNLLTINGGDIKNLYVGVADYNPEKQNTTICGGHIVTLTVANESDNNVIVFGGTFDFEIDNKYLADGVKLTYDEKTGTYGTSVSHGLKVIATSSSKIKDLVIKDGQLVFIRDLGRIALDYKGTRTFYNDIFEIESEQERLDLKEPINGKYYFVIETAILWRYFDGWVQITTPPEEIVFIGIELPELGQPKTLYVNKKEREISVWDEDTEDYLPVSNYTECATPDEIKTLWENTTI